MELMRLSWSQVSADKHQIGIVYHPWSAIPMMSFPRQSFDFCFVKRDETPERIRLIGHGESLVPNSDQSSEIELLVSPSSHAFV
jgi:hypothetical protein